MYKITGKRKLFTLMYGINPLVLFEGLANVHNELLLIFFILLGLFFFLKKKNLLLTVIAFALGAGVKYVAILLIPFIVLYYYRKEKTLKKIIYSILWGGLFLIVILLCYSMYMRNFDFLNGIIIQQGKFANSILTMLAIKKFDMALILSKGFMLAFVIIYIITILKLILKKRQYNAFSTYIRKYNGLLVLFIFATITNFQCWYTLWILATVMWDSSKNIRWLISITLLSQACNIIYFLTYEHYVFGAIYSIMLIISITFTKTILNRKDKIIGSRE